MELFHAGAENPAERARNEILVISGFAENSVEVECEMLRKQNANLQLFSVDLA